MPRSGSSSPLLSGHPSRLVLWWSSSVSRMNSSSLLGSQDRNGVPWKDHYLHFRLKTETRCFLTVDDVDLIDEASDIE